MSETLLGCPFCGTQPNLRRSVEEYPADEDGPAGEFDVQTSVDCDECGISVSAEYRDEAIEAWNRRTPSLPASAEGVEAILHAALDCPHEIDGEKVVLKASLSKPGNALAQLSTRLSAALKAETSR